MRRLLIFFLIAVVLAGVLVSSAVATVRVTKPTGAREPRRRCFSDGYRVSEGALHDGVDYSTTRSRARGLGAKRGGTITWTWTVGSNTNPCAWPVKIDCGTSGKAQTSVTVR